MESKKSGSGLLNFKLRKIVHYSLILCILLIQLIIAAFFYNEFVNRKSLTFIEKQLKELQTLENITDNSKQELLNAQGYFQEYLQTEDKKYLKSYFNSVSKLSSNLESINRFQKKNPQFNFDISKKRKDTSEVKNLKVLIDLTQEYSSKNSPKTKIELPKLQKYEVNFDFDKYDVKTETFSDTIKKKGLFGRLGDAIAGKESVRKDSTVVILEKGRGSNFSKMKTEVDSLLTSVNNHYTKEIKTIQVNVIKNNNKDGGEFYKIFNKLLVSSNDLMTVYESAVKDAKSKLEKELAVQNSKNNKIRTNLILGLMILMFIVSILIMYFTRIAFIYEQKLNKANKQIKENLNFKNRILGMLSHELRSPLKIIGIFINRINKKTEDPTIKESLKSISFTNNTLLMQANQILEYTKNQQVENKLNSVVFNLSNEIDSILNSIEPYIATRNNRFVIDKNIDPQVMVFSDNTKINQIFMNILGNANKFTENGQIKVITKTKIVDEHTISLITEISDTGVGISKSDLKKIFEPYYQGVLSDEVENLGAGLGLSLCKEIIELYPGEINVTSELNKGTTVYFAINLKLSK